MRPLILLPLALALAPVAGCGRDPEQAPAIALADNGVPVDAARTARPMPRAAPDATGPGTALGLTYLQLEDADLVDAAGREIAEVERIDADQAGTIGGLIVETKGGVADGKRVRIPIAGLSVVPDGDDYDLRTTMTADRLAALPAAPAPR